MQIRPRVIPCLLLDGDRLIKTVKFKNEKYIGDPINAVKIFNDKQADELFFIDKSASKRGSINLKLLEKISSQSFMPLGYAGGIKSLNDAQKVFSLGFEKISINSGTLNNNNLITEISKIYGNQSVVVSIDIKKNIFGKYKVYSHIDNKNTKLCPFEYAKKLEKLGAGEIIINDVDNDGCMNGYNYDLIKIISDIVSIPVIALGGAGKFSHLKKALHEGRASAVGVGSMFIFHGPYRAVLINYLSNEDILKLN